MGNTLETLYNLLQINRKIEDAPLRYMYLKDVWGMEQQAIADIEGVSQSQVSKEIIKIRKKVSRETLLEKTKELFSPEEIQYIHMLPREILPDIPAIAFINDILGIRPIHGFFDYIDTNTNSRIVGLAWLGIQNKKLVELYKVKQPTVSMIVKRSIDRIDKVNYVNRYDHVHEYKFKLKPRETYTNFIKAGGMN